MKPVIASLLVAGIAAATLISARPALADPAVATDAPPVVVALNYQLPPRLTLTNPAPTQQPMKLGTTMRFAVYVLQAFDAAQSARALRAGGREQNPLMRPFSHGGALTMGVGFAVGDLIRGAITRRAAPSVKIGSDAVQAISNVEGIIATRATLAGGTLH